MQSQLKGSYGDKAIPKLDYLSRNRNFTNEINGNVNEDKFSRSLNAPKAVMEVTLKSDSDFDWGETNTQKKFKIWSPTSELVRNLPQLKSYSKPYDITRNDENNNLDKLEDDKFEHNQSHHSNSIAEHRATGSNEIPALLASVGESMKQINQILYGKSPGEFTLSSAPNTRREANERSYIENFNGNPDLSVRFSDLPRRNEAIESSLPRKLGPGNEYFSPLQSGREEYEEKRTNNISEPNRFSLVETGEDRYQRSHSERKYEIKSPVPARTLSVPKILEHKQEEFSSNQNKDDRTSINSRRLKLPGEKEDFSGRKGRTDPNSYLLDVEYIQDQTVAPNKTYSKEDIIAIDLILPPEKIRQILNQKDLIIIEGELLKYKPGLHYNFSKRWVQATMRELRYYKTRWAANCWEARPIFSITFEEIRGLMRVNMKLPKNIKIEGPDKGVKKFAPKLYQFELFPYNDETEQYSKILGKIDENNGSKSERSNIVDPKQKSKINIFQIEKGHLMCAPALQREGKYPSGLKPKIQNEPSSINESVIKPRSFASSRDFSLRTLINDLNQKPKNGKERISNYVPENIIHENPDDSNNFKSKEKKNRWVKDIEDLASWTGREKEWYFAEKRLLFATQSSREREVWLSVLNWVINQNS